MSLMLPCCCPLAWLRGCEPSSVLQPLPIHGCVDPEAPPSDPAPCPNPPLLLCLPKRALPFIWLIWIPTWKTSDELCELLPCMTRLLINQPSDSTHINRAASALWPGAPEWSTCTRGRHLVHFLIYLNLQPFVKHMHYYSMPTWSILKL